jgi:AcrR family transcriptional regulator
VLRCWADGLLRGVGDNMVYRHTRKPEVVPVPHPTRQLLLETAVEVIGEVGLDAVDMSMVIKRAGVTTGALYHHFRDFGHLLEEAMAVRFPVGVRESLAMITEGLASATTLEEYQQFMRDLAVASQAPGNKARRMERARYLAIAFSSESMRKVIAQQQQEMTAQLTAALEEVSRRGWLRTDLSPKAVAIFIQAYTLGRIVDDITDDPVDPDEWINLIVTVMTRALSAD